MNNKQMPVVGSIWKRSILIGIIIDVMPQANDSDYEFDMQIFNFKTHEIQTGVGWTINEWHKDWQLIASL